MVNHNLNNLNNLDNNLPNIPEDSENPPKRVKSEHSDSDGADNADNADNGDNGDVDISDAPGSTNAVASPPVMLPKITVESQYGAVPINKVGDQTMKVLVTVTPPEIDPAAAKTAHVVLCLDESYSMQGPSMNLLKQVVGRLFKDGIHGTKLYLRVLMFGGKVRDMKIRANAMLQLNDHTREDFLSIAEGMEARQGRTNISDAAFAAIDVLNDFRKECVLNKCEVPGTGHVILLTDGQANEGILFGDEFKQVITEHIGDAPFFTHFIGLGADVNAAYMKAATDGGKCGVFAVAPTADQIGKAFENVFGYVVECTHPLTLKVDDANGPRLLKHGMLQSTARSVLVDVRVPNQWMPGAQALCRVTLKCVEGLPEASQPSTLCFVDYKDGLDAMARPNDAVQKALEREEVDAKTVELMADAPDLATGSAKIQKYMQDSGDRLGADALARLQVVSDKAASDHAVYRSLGAAGPELYAVASATQSAYM